VGGAVRPRRRRGPHPIGRSGASPVKTNSLNDKTINVSLPGLSTAAPTSTPGRRPRPKRSTTSLSVGLPHTSAATSTGRAAHRLGRADLADARDREYTITRNEKWSNGTSLTATTCSAGGCGSALRTCSPTGTATSRRFGLQGRRRRDRRLRHALRDWNLLFRDVEALGTRAVVRSRRCGATVARASTRSPARRRVASC